MSPVPVPTLSSGIGVVTAMITPALLISACAMFILSTSNRLGRVVDRVRALSDQLEALVHGTDQRVLLEERRASVTLQMTQLSRRASLLQRSLTVFYSAAGIFVASSVTIGVVALYFPRAGWVPVMLALFGSLFLLFASALLILEAQFAFISLKGEMRFVRALLAVLSERR